ncbi:MAG: restriction endonuclease subunit S [Planctomycetes bacterium]|nr:restriction endonuclease subunit S [Planctomycetota bacterium]
MIADMMNLGGLTKIRTGKLDANASSEDGQYPFFTCARQPLRIDSYTYDCKCVLVAGNGDLNVKYYDGKFDAYQRTYIVEVRPESKDGLHFRYVYHFLETYLETLREQSIDGIIKYIKLGNLTEAKIPLPPLVEQKRIAGILDAADALRTKRRESLAELGTLLQATFLEMFGDPVTNPRGWKTSTLGSLIKVGPQNGLYKPSKEYGSGTRILRIDGFYDGKVTNLEGLKLVRVSGKEREKYGLVENDIVINRVNSRKYLGKCALIPKLSEPTVYESNMMRFSVAVDSLQPCFPV